jgi:hypothetical protein
LFVSSFHLQASLWWYWPTQIIQDSFLPLKSSD